MVREFKDEYDAEFTDEQLKRIDELDNAAYQFALTLTELAKEGNKNGDKELPWNMSYIGEILDDCTEIMEGRGYTVRYPFFIETREGKTFSCDYNYESSATNKKSRKRKDFIVKFNSNIEEFENRQYSFASEEEAENAIVEDTMVLYKEFVNAYGKAVTVIGNKKETCIAVANTSFYASWIRSWIENW